MSTAILESASGWQSGISSCVRFAAMMPAMRAAPSTSPFLALPSSTRSSVFAVITTRPSATATRSVAAFADTSTMRASPPLAEMGELAGARHRLLRGAGRRCGRRDERAGGAPRRRARASGSRPPGRCEMPTRGKIYRDRRGEKIPLSPTAMRPAGIFGASRLLVASVVSKVCRLRLLMPIRRERRRSARSSSHSSCTSSSTSMPKAAAVSSRSCASASSTAAMMIRMQSAPQARASAT